MTSNRDKNNSNDLVFSRFISVMNNVKTWSGTMTQLKSQMKRNSSKNQRQMISEMAPNQIRILLNKNMRRIKTIMNISFSIVGNERKRVCTVELKRSNKR